MLKILQATLQHYMSHEFPDVQAGFRKARGTRDEIANIRWSSKKQESSRKTSSSTLLTMPKALAMWITTNCGKLWKRWEYQTTWLAFWEICMQVKKQQLELNMEQQTGSKSGKEYIKAVYCHPAYLTYMQSTSWEIPGWMKHKLESRLLEVINNLRYADDTTLMAESKEELKSLLMKVKEESAKVGLKLNIQKMKIMASGPKWIASEIYLIILITIEFHYQNNITSWGYERKFWNGDSPVERVVKENTFGFSSPPHMNSIY